MQKKQQKQVQQTKQNQKVYSSPHSFSSKTNILEHSANLNDPYVTPKIQSNSSYEKALTKTQVSSSNLPTFQTLQVLFSYLQLKLTSIKQMTSKENNTNQKIDQIIYLFRDCLSNSHLDRQYRNRIQHQNEGRFQSQSFFKNILNYLTSYCKEPTQYQYEDYDDLTNQIIELAQEAPDSTEIQFIDELFKCFRAKLKQEKQTVTTIFMQQSKSYVQNYTLFDKQLNNLVNALYEKEIMISSLTRNPAILVQKEQLIIPNQDISLQQILSQCNQPKSYFKNLLIFAQQNHLILKIQLQNLIKMKSNQIQQLNNLKFAQQTNKQYVNAIPDQNNQLKDNNISLKNEINSLQEKLKQKQQQESSLTLETKYLQLSQKIKELYSCDGFNIFQRQIIQKILELQQRTIQDKNKIIQQMQQKFVDAQSFFEHTIRIRQKSIKQIEQNLRKEQLKSNKQFQNIKILTQQNKQLKANIQSSNKQLDFSKKASEQLHTKIGILESKLGVFSDISQGKILEKQLIENHIKQIADLKHEVQMNINININNENLFKKLQDQNKDLIKQLIKLESKIPKCEPIIDQDQFEELNDKINYFEQHFQGINPQKYHQMQSIIPHLNQQIQYLRHQVQKFQQARQEYNNQKIKIQNSYKQQITSLIEYVQNVKKDKQQLFVEKIQLCNKIAGAENQFRQRIGGMSNYIQNLQKKLTQNQSQKQFPALQQQIEKIEQQNRDLKIRVQEAESFIAYLKHENQQKQEEVDALRQQLEDKQAQLEYKDKQKQMMKQLLQNLQKQNIQSIKKSLQINQQCQRFLAEIKELRIQRDQAQKAYEQSQKIYKQQIKLHEQEIKQLYTKNHNLEEQLGQQINKKQHIYLISEKLKLENQQLQIKLSNLKSRQEQELFNEMQNKHLSEKFMQIIQENNQLKKIIDLNELKLQQQQTHIQSLIQQIQSQQSFIIQKKRQIQQMGLSIQTQIQDLQTEMSSKQYQNQQQISAYQQEILQLKNKIGADQQEILQLKNKIGAHQQEILQLKNTQQNECRQMLTLKNHYQLLVQENNKLFQQQVEKVLQQYRQKISTLQQQIQQSQQMQLQIQCQQCSKKDQIILGQQTEIYQLKDKNILLLKDFEQIKQQLEVSNNKYYGEVQQKQEYSRQFTYYKQKYIGALKVMDHLKQQNNKLSKQLFQSIKVVLEPHKIKNILAHHVSTDELKSKNQKLSVEKKAGELEQQLMLTKKINNCLCKTQNEQEKKYDQPLIDNYIDDIEENSCASVSQDEFLEYIKRKQDGSSMQSSLGKQTESQLDIIGKMSKRLQTVIRSKNQLQNKCAYYQNIENEKFINFVEEIQVCIQNLINFLSQSRLLQLKDGNKFIFSYEESADHQISSKTTNYTFFAYFQNFFKRLFDNIIQNTDGYKQKQQHQDFIEYLRYLLKEFITHNDEKALEQIVRILQ